MIKEAIGYGATTEEAYENAVLKLDAKDDADIQFEVIAGPKKKVLGLFGGAQAQVRAYIEIPDQKKKEKPAAKPKKENAKPKKEVKKEAPKAAKAPAAQEDIAFVTEDELPEGSRAKNAINYLKPILENLGCTNISLKVAAKENSALIDLEGEGLGVIIGHRGETLDSLQYLAGLAANNGGGYYKVSLNIGDYRQRREETLINLAGRICKQVIETGKCRTLEPMNPYERRIIHTAVQNFDGVTSASFGEGADRRVVIGIEGTELKPLRQNKGRRDDRRDNRRHRSNRSNNNTAASAPAREPKKDSDIPLYGKIN